MIPFLAKSTHHLGALGCRRAFQSHLRYRIATLAIAACTAILTQSIDTPPLKAEERDRPNILLIMTDDQGYWDTRATGNPHLSTPAMDAIAGDGVQLRRYYAAPVCAPTRAGMMTGRYYLRTGLYNTRFGGDSMGLQEITIAERLRDAGYRTGLFGKWHLGKYAGYQPQDRGFDEFMGHYQGHLERYQFPDQIFHNGKAVEARGYVSDLFTDASIDFIEHCIEKTDKPFFCSLMFNSPHSPFLLDTSHYGQPDGDRLIAKYLDQGLPLREARIYGLIERVDQNVGRVLKKLEELGIQRDTLVVFTSDNGGVSRAFKAGLNGFKASTYEGGVRAPCFVRWPGKIEAGSVIDAQTSHIDWLPTFCELANTTVPDDRTIDGISLVPLLRSKSDDNGEFRPHHKYVYHTWDRYTPNPDRRWSISDDRWKLMGLFGNDATPNPKKWRLYDLRNDPGETKNLMKKKPEILARLRSEFEKWFADVTGGQTYQPIAIPIGDSREPVVDIEPSWAKYSGDSTEYVFDGYDWDTIEGWRDPGDSVTWKVNAAEGGDYRISVRYGCRRLDAGGHVRVIVNGTPIDHKVQPTSTSEQFAWFDLGEVTIRSGPRMIKVELVDCPGDELMRLNRLRIQKVAP